MNNKFAVLDLETTGHSPKNKDKIIQIGLVVVQNGTIIDRFSSYINPNMAIPPFISSLTGIDQSTVKDAPAFDEVAPQLLKLLDGACLVAHNIQFDLSFLNAELDNAGYFEWRGMMIDTVELSRILMPNLDSYKLSQLSESLALEHSQPHQADSDAEATGMLLLELLNRLEALPLLTLQRLHPLVEGLHSDVADLVQECVNRKLSQLEEEVPDLDVYRQLVLRKMGDLLSDPEEYFDESLTHQNIQERLSESLPNYEKRHGQHEMMDVVERSLADGHHALIEAGTGIGKSLGYLIPGLLHAKRTGRPLIVSTHTIQLQEQLLDRDIPLLQQMVPFDFNAAVLKGRNHYLCLRKFEQQLEQIYDNNYDVLLAKAQLLVWLTTTAEGDIEELNLPSGGQLFWHQVKSDSNSCLNHKCPWFSRCFYHRSKREAYDADIIITNHALLFTDLVNDHTLIPAYKEVVIDEAHHLDEIASDHFGMQTDYFSFHRVLERLGTSEETTVNLWLKLEEILKTVDVPYEKGVVNTFKDLKFEIDQLFSMIKTYVVGRGHKKSEAGKINFRFAAKDSDPTWYAEMKEVFARVQLQANDLLRDCRDLVKKAQKHEDHLNVHQKGVLVDYTGLLNKLDEERNILGHMLLSTNEDEVCWIETDQGGARNAVSLYNQPIDISDRLSSDFFEKKRSVILTSATLTIRNRFDFVRKRLGIDDEAENVQLNSPFNYRRQAKIMIPTDLPMIKDVSTDEYSVTIAEAIYRIAHVTEGRMLVLFTSYDMLKKTYHRFKELTDPEDFSLIGQGIDSGSRARLTKNFKQLDRAVLFGTSSFWEGVDIPGNDLSCLIIVRLPFNPPDNPVIEARSEQLRKQGKSPFMELSLPQAIIRFKQGFGRLVRSSSDHGAVFVFDRRIVVTKYGKSFIRSLPDVPVQEGTMDELLDDLEDFLV